MIKTKLESRRFIMPIILFILFIVLGYLVKYQPVLEFDLAISRSFSAFRPVWLVNTMKMITRTGYLKWGGAAVIVIAIILALYKYYRAATFLIVAMSAALIANYFKYYFLRVRPDPAIIGFETIAASGPSFPSGHATFSAAVYGFMIILIFLKVKGKKKYYLASMPTMLLTAILFSRVYLGVHYFTDVLGGLLLGGAWSLSLSVTYLFLLSRNKS